MTPQQIVGLGIRLLALLLAFSALRYLGYTASDVFPTDISAQTKVAHWIAAIYLIAAALLWFVPMWIAHKLLPRTKFENRMELHGLELARVGCSLIGLWLFASALPDVIWFLFQAFLVVGNASLFRTLNTEAKLDVAISVAQIMFAAALVVRSGDFAQIVFRGNSKAVNSGDDQDTLTRN